MAVCMLRSYAAIFLFVLLIMSKAYEVRQSNKSNMFSFIEGRLWQFVVGTVAHECQHLWRKHENKPCVADEATDPLLESERRELTDGEPAKLVDEVSYIILSINGGREEFYRGRQVHEGRGWGQNPGPGPGPAPSGPPAGRHLLSAGPPAGYGNFSFRIYKTVGPTLAFFFGKVVAILSQNAYFCRYRAAGPAPLPTPISMAGPAPALAPCYSATVYD